MGLGASVAFLGAAKHSERSLGFQGIREHHNLKAYLRSQSRIARDDFEWILDRVRNRAQRHRGSPTPTSWLIVSDRKCYTSEEQLYPIRKHRRALFSRFGITFRFCDLTRAMTLTNHALASFSVIGLKFAWHTPPSQVAAYIQHFCDTAPHSRLVYFDGDDDLCVGFPEALASSAVYVKKHFFSRTSDACRTVVGKSNLTDFVARTYGISVSHQAIKSTPGVPPHLQPRIFVGWNIALDSWFDRPVAPTFVSPDRHRPIDIWCRATARADDWISPLRRAPADALTALAARYNVALPVSGRIPQPQYYQDLCNSKLCVSPFGYGELCWRDFEAIRCGCVLIKPDMSHVRTRPCLFNPHQTYLPVAWDYSDLTAVCDRVLGDDPLRLHIARQAMDALTSSLTPDWFCDVWGYLLQVLDS